jgi:putative phosphoesterase
MNGASMHRIGVISDTHGLLRPEAVAALARMDRIIHAGDIGRPEILAALSEIAPVTAVRGNNDEGAWAEAIPQSVVLGVEGRLVQVVHDIADLEGDPADLGYTVVVTGHSHKPSIRRERGVLFLNPGSAGPRRFKLPVSVAKLTISERRVQASIDELSIRS